MWTTSWGKFLTNDNLKKKGITLVDQCCMCRCNGETRDHLLLHCDVACALWSYFFCVFGVHWVMLNRVIDLM